MGKLLAGGDYREEGRRYDLSVPLEVMEAIEGEDPTELGPQPGAGRYPAGHCAMGCGDVDAASWPYDPVTGLPLPLGGLPAQPGGELQPETDSEKEDCQR